MHTIKFNHGSSSLRALALTLCTFIASATWSDVQSEQYVIRLSPAPRHLETMKTITGLGSATAVLEGRRLSISGKFSGLAGPATAAQIRQGRKGIPGPVLFPLNVSQAAEGEVSGTVELSAAQVKLLREESLYIQIDSAAAPDGNLRGWISPPKKR